MPAGAVLTAGLARYRRRFGGEGTVVTLADGRAFTAAHCLAAVDGRPGTVIAAVNGRQWRVRRRFSPRGRDVALLDAVGPPRSRAAVPARGWRLAASAVLRPGVVVEFHGHAGGRFRVRRAVVTVVTATRAVASVLSRAGVAAGDSGGPVWVDGALTGIVVARTGRAVSAVASSHVVLARLDSWRVPPPPR